MLGRKNRKWWFGMSSVVALLLAGLVLTGRSVSQDIDSSRKIVSKSTPIFPDLARKMHLSGKVKVEVSINPAGSVTSAKLVGGNPVFEANAIDAVKRWKFESAPGQTKAVIIVEFADQ